MATVFRSFPTSERLRQGKSAIPSLLELLGMDVWRHFDDFNGDTITGGTAPGTYQSTASGAGSAAFGVNTGQINGQARLAPGTDDDGYSNYSLGLHCLGNRNAHVWHRIITPSLVSSWKFELGFTDVVSGTDAGAQSGKSGNGTWNATDAVIIVLDTDTNNTLSLMAVKNGTAATRRDFNYTGLSGNSEYYLGVELRDTSARGYLLNGDGELLEDTGWMTNAVTATVQLTPWGHSQNRTTSARNLSLDMVLAYQRRTATA